MFRELFFKKPPFFKTAKENYCSGVSTLLNDRARVGHNKPTFTIHALHSAARLGYLNLSNLIPSFQTDGTDTRTSSKSRKCTKIHNDTSIFRAFFKVLV
jgi:hypothetical protein